MKKNAIWRILGLVLLTAVLLTACGQGKGEQNQDQAPVLPENYDDLVMLAKLDLSLKTGANIENIKTVSVEQVNFSDASLGVREPGVEYAQVVTPGLIILLKTDGKDYEYHASGAMVIQVPESDF